MPICVMWKRTALKAMPLSKLEQSKITDSALKIQSAQASLEKLDETKVKDFSNIQECLKMAEIHLRQALREKGPAKAV
jgi:hypothetical protein